MLGPSSREEAELPQGSSRKTLCLCSCRSENFQLLPSAPCNFPETPGVKPLMFQNSGLETLASPPLLKPAASISKGATACSLTESCVIRMGERAAYGLGVHRV